MSLEQAFEILGVTPDCTARAARRAYLRLLRQNKPDRDPEGFKRLREAYEAVKAFLEGEPLSRIVALDARLARVVGRGEELPVEPLDPVPVEPLDPFLKRLQALAPDDVEERLAIARQAVRELPDDHDAYRLLAFLAAQCDRHEEARIALRAGVAKGFDDCFELLLERYAPNLTADELASAGESSHPDLLLVAASEHIRRGQAATATRVALRAFEVAEKTGTRLPVPAAVRVVLELHTDGRLEPAETVALQLDDWLDVHGSFRDLDAEAAVIWRLAGELRQLPREFPQRLRSAIVRGMLDGRMSDVSDAVHDYAMTEPHGAVEAARLLERAPTLTSFYHHLLSGPLSGRTDADRTAEGFRALWYVVMIFIGIGGLRSCPNRSVPKPKNLARVDVASIWTADSNAPAFAELCGSGDPPTPNLCINAVAALSHLGNGRCSAALETLVVADAGVAGELARMAPAPPQQDEAEEMEATVIGVDVPPAGEPVAPEDPEVLVRLAVTELTGLWKDGCRQTIRLRERDRETYPVTATYCQDPETFIGLGACNHARYLALMTSIGICDVGREHFDALGRLLEAVDPEAALRPIVAEVGARFQEICGADQAP